jgi:hypothetical protein
LSVFPQAFRGEISGIFHELAHLTVRQHL